MLASLRSLAAEPRSDPCRQQRRLFVWGVALGGLLAGDVEAGRLEPSTKADDVKGPGDRETVRVFPGFAVLIAIRGGDQDPAGTAIDVGQFVYGLHCKGPGPANHQCSP